MMSKDKPKKLKKIFYLRKLVKKQLRMSIEVHFCFNCAGNEYDGNLASCFQAWADVNAKSLQTFIAPHFKDLSDIVKNVPISYRVNSYEICLKINVGKKHMRKLNNNKCEEIATLIQSTEDETFNENNYRHIDVRKWGWKKDKEDDEEGDENDFRFFVEIGFIEIDRHD